MRIQEAKNAKAVVVIVHGAFEHSGRYDWVVEQLVTHGYHVVYGDLPGQGENIPSKRGHIRSFQQYIETVKTWVDQAKTYELPVFLLGHSMGGLISIRFVQTMNTSLDGVILSSPAVGITSGPNKALRAIASLMNPFYPSLRVKTGIQSSAATRNEEFVAQDKDDPLFLRKVSIRWFLEFQKAAEQANKNVNHYKNIPTLMLQSGKDQLVDKDVSIDWFNKINVNEKSIHVYDELYHELLNEPEREEVMREIVQFIEGKRQRTH
ncbi:alpha/beta hydrolase [Allobacillus sp. GCM10007491]|uniref:Lysophospholipase n=1 Tax=Allobacillus saliphilus TaxID=2912308 RepID=A0A941HU36_9BACI|nr:alpha/beta hydrolase [Allobacillus saliphilus]MBR7555008.1 lysophospholipase [Allobacillus saliphilus]